MRYEARATSHTMNTKKYLCLNEEHEKWAIARKIT